MNLPETSRNDTPNSLNRLMVLIGATLVALAVFFIGFISGKYLEGSSLGFDNVVNITGLRQNSKVTNLDFDLFWQVWSDLDSRYVDESLSDQDLYYGAIKGLVAGAEDPVTVFLSPEETAQYEDSNQGKFEGIGAELGYDGGVIIVVSPLDGSPALTAGLRTGDAILKVDGQDIIGDSVFQVVSKIRGEKDSEVVLTVLHEGETEQSDISITRGEITVPSVEFDGMTDDVAIVDLDRFTEATFAEWKNKWDEVVDEVDRENPKALILDLRGNPGGFFNAAVWAAGDFLEEGSVVAIQQDRSESEVQFTVQREGSLLDVPLVVLVDAGSASSSEILAGSLKFHNRAYIIGETTHGKGTAQEIIDYSDGSTLHITTMKWLLPDGEWLNPDNAIVPDLEVEFSNEDFLAGNDPQMDSAMEYINSEL